MLGTINNNMKSLFFIIICFISFNSIAQQEKSTIEEEEIMYADKINGSLVPWNNKEKKEFTSICLEKNKNIEKPTRFCKCSLKSLSKGLNYETFINSSDSLKNKLYSFHGWRDLECK